MIDPMKPQNWNKPLIAVDSQGGVFPVKISNASGKPTVWGWSIYRRQPGYRTLGISVEIMTKELGWKFYSAEVV